MYDEVCYDRPFLNQVIVRVDFFSPIAALEKLVPPKLSNVIAKHFPIGEPTDLFTQEIMMGQNPDGPGELHHRQSKTKQWNYFGKEREKQLSLTSQFFSITYSKYKNYEEAKLHFSAVLDALIREFPEAKGARFGLRYINQIIDLELPAPTDWKKFINEELLSTIKFFENPDRLTRLVHIAELSEGDIGVRFQFGMPNPDYPAIMKRPMFILDLDASIMTAHELSSDMQSIDQAHDVIQRLFEKSITQTLREKMNVKPAVAVQ